MASCLRQQEECYRLADAYLDEFEELAEADKALRSALMKVELRLQRARAYFLSDEQQSVVLDLIAEVGADIRRFCEYMGVKGIEKIPAHEFEDAVSALEAKRRSVA
jgi:hypothetical protein